MKTGYHRRAGFNLVSTAEREGQRFISIIMGAKNSRLRGQSVTHLLNYGFNNFTKYFLSMLHVHVRVYFFMLSIFI